MLIIAMLLFVLVLALFIFAFIGFFTIKSWFYNTEWAKNNRNLTNLLFDERRKEDDYVPGFIWSVVGIGALLPSGVAISILQSHYEVKEVLGQPYLPITGPIILVVLLITIMGPLPYHLYKNRKNKDYLKSIKNQRFTETQFKTGNKIISNKLTQNKIERSKNLTLPPFYCQLCSVKHAAGTPRMQCEQCGRNLCVESFSEMVKAGRTTCPMCDGILVSVNTQG